MRPGRIVVGIVAGLVPIAAPVHLLFSQPDALAVPATARVEAPALPGATAPAASTRDRIAAYRGLGAWIDIYDRSPWRSPRRAVARLASAGVDTIYLQTGNYRVRSDLYRPRKLAAILDSAHRRGIAVVAWYAPAFTNPREDLRRSLAALRFTTESGQRFDSFALDIELPAVPVHVRNERLERLGDAVRTAAGRRYPLGAIVPEAGANYWPRFPYRAVARRFDVFLPMAYYTFRTTGRAGVRAYIARNIDAIKRHAGRRTPVHVIGGIAGAGPASDVRAFVSASRRRAIGASLYDYPITTAIEWAALDRVPRR